MFSSVDSFLTPRPVNWITGPGTMSPSNCSFEQEYVFVDKFGSLRPDVLSDIAAGLADAKYGANDVVCGV